MKRIIQLEELGHTALGIFAVTFLPFDFSWWIWLLLFFSPDISIIAYAAGTQSGAVIYNLAHHRGLAIALAALGFLVKLDWAMLAGAILYGHASFDRLLGYGLKYTDDFKHTHLGWIGKKQFIKQEN